MDHLGTAKEESDAETFSGVRLSKGATRAEGLAALRRMLVGKALSRARSQCPGNHFHRGPDEVLRSGRFSPR